MLFGYVGFGYGGRQHAGRRPDEDALAKPQNIMGT
jgi:hypothetical protein